MIIDSETLVQSAKIARNHNCSSNTIGVKADVNLKKWTWWRCWFYRHLRARWRENGAVKWAKEHRLSAFQRWEITRSIRPPKAPARALVLSSSSALHPLLNPTLNFSWEIDHKLRTCFKPIQIDIKCWSISTEMKLHFMENEWKSRENWPGIPLCEFSTCRLYSSISWSETESKGFLAYGVLFQRERERERKRTPKFSHSTDQLSLAVGRKLTCRPWRDAGNLVEWFLWKRRQPRPRDRQFRSCGRPAIPPPNKKNYYY